MTHVSTPSTSDSARDSFGADSFTTSEFRDNRRRASLPPDALFRRAGSASRNELRLRHAGRFDGCGLSELSATRRIASAWSTLLNTTTAASG